LSHQDEHHFASDTWKDSICVLSEVKVDFHAGFQFPENNIMDEEFAKSRHFMFFGTDNSLFENIDFECVRLITSM